MFECFKYRYFSQGSNRYTLAVLILSNFDLFECHSGLSLFVYHYSDCSKSALADARNVLVSRGKCKGLARLGDGAVLEGDFFHLIMQTYISQYLDYK